MYTVECIHVRYMIYGPHFKLNCHNSAHTLQIQYLCMYIYIYIYISYYIYHIIYYIYTLYIYIYVHYIYIYAYTHIVSFILSYPARSSCKELYLAPPRIPALVGEVPVSLWMNRTNFTLQGIREGIAELFWGTLRKDPLPVSGDI